MEQEQVAGGSFDGGFGGAPICIHVTRQVRRESTEVEGIPGSAAGIARPTLCWALSVVALGACHSWPATSSGGHSARSFSRDWLDPSSVDLTSPNPLNCNSCSFTFCSPPSPRRENSCWLSTVAKFCSHTSHVNASRASPQRRSVVAASSNTSRPFAVNRAPVLPKRTRNLISHTEPFLCHSSCACQRPRSIVGTLSWSF